MSLVPAQPYLPQQVNHPATSGASDERSGDPGMHDMPLALLSPQAFSETAIVIGVQQRHLPTGTSELVVAPDDEQQQAFDRLITKLDAACAQLRPGQQGRNLADRLLRAAMSIELPQGVACLQMPGGAPLIIVRVDLLREHGLDKVVRHAHCAQILRAQSQGLAVNEASLAAYGLSGASPRPHREQSTVGV